MKKVLERITASLPEILIIGLVLILFGYSFIQDERSSTQEEKTIKNELSEEKTEEGRGNDTEGSGNNEQVAENKSDDNALQQDENLSLVTHTIDGDTYIVHIDGKEEKVRVIGIDTPEKEGGFRVEGCFGDHASDYVKTTLRGKKISLLLPQDYDNTDKYGRLLRYVFFEGEDFGAHLISEGYAFAMTKFNHPRKKYYLELEKKAQQEKKGMWNRENCTYY